ncbi:MAG: metallophosphoesterase [bacterium]|nr:metallophosphoesterase [bacterium]
MSSDNTPSDLDARRVELWQKRREIEIRREQSHCLKPDSFAGWFYAMTVFDLFPPILKYTGLLHLGRHYARKLQLLGVSFEFDSLPEVFDGFRILHMSDTHFIEEEPDFSSMLCGLIKDAEVDLCVMTGDYRFEHEGPIEHVVDSMRELTAAVRSRHGICAVLGNHDRTTFAQPLRDMGIDLLMNDSVPIDRNGERIWIVGVDDHHHFRCDDLPMAMTDVASDAFSVLLAHSPEIGDQAAERNVDLYLCGHTHWGQVRLPWLGAVFTNARCPRAWCTADWHHNGMHGYTSSGLGVTDLPVRFNCPPSAAVIELRRKGPHPR